MFDLDNFFSFALSQREEEVGVKLLVIFFSLFEIVSPW